MQGLRLPHNRLAYEEFMEKRTKPSLEALTDRATEAADILAHLANEKRLLLMCHLATIGECCGRECDGARDRCDRREELGSR